MTLRQCINNILFEDNANAYVERLYKDVLLNIMKQTNLNQLSYINFNKKRIEKANKSKDFIMLPNNKNDFTKIVLNWFKNYPEFYKTYYNFIIKASNHYFDNFKLR